MFIINHHRFYLPPGIESSAGGIGLVLSNYLLYFAVIYHHHYDQHYHYDYNNIEQYIALHWF